MFIGHFLGLGFLSLFYNYGRNIQSERIYYNLDLKVDENKIDNISKNIDRIMAGYIKPNEKYDITNEVLREKMNNFNERFIMLLSAMLFICVILLNIANSYSTTNLSFFNRKAEIGTLLSCGMDVSDLEKLLKNNMKKQLSLSLLTSLILTMALIVYFVKTLPTHISFKNIFIFMRYEILIPVVLIVIISSYIIHYFAMEKITRKSIINLIKTD